MDIENVKNRLHSISAHLLYIEDAMKADDKVMVSTHIRHISDMVWDVRQELTK